MNIKTFLKRNSVIRKIGKRYNINKQFKQDARDFINYYIEAAEEKGDYRYSILLLTHSLEKGMCFSNPRPFGVDKVTEMISILSNYPEKCKNGFEYRLGFAVLKAWIDFYNDHNWQSEKMYNEVSDFLKINNCDVKIVSGTKAYTPIYSEDASNVYDKYFLNRHSVRDYQDRKLNIDDIRFALKCFIDTPTACNRQMCHIYYIKNPELSNLLKKVVVGIPGINKKTVQFFVITYDLSSFAYSGERQQGMFNAGLCTMSFINGLHAKGIGSCCLQWSNKSNQDCMVRRSLGLRDSERIGVVVGAGYYLEKNVIPCSARKSTDDFFTVL
ncbi:nitroreductase family protein [Ruminococcus sp.]|uniref:nitroreductase family protein n=1 Tax=Ruminococcus sp. TaxID=41978 RepID=UPI0025F7B42C|nr:nitroreductase family protein [Ruminococcus sp.]